MSFLYGYCDLRGGCEIHIAFPILHIACCQLSILLYSYTPILLYPKLGRRKESYLLGVYLVSWESNSFINSAPTEFGRIVRVQTCWWLESMVMVWEAGIERSCWQVGGSIVAAEALK